MLEFRLGFLRLGPCLNDLKESIGALYRLRKGFVGAFLQQGVATRSLLPKYLGPLVGPVLSISVGFKIYRLYRR